MTAMKEMIEAARTEFWRVLAIKELTLEDAWRAALEAAGRATSKPIKPKPPVCDCCKRTVEKVRGSMWHGESKICIECFHQWYDPDNDEVDPTKPLSIGNYVRKKHGLPPLEKT
jgi:hypothetical protein